MIELHPASGEIVDVPVIVGVMLLPSALVFAFGAVLALVRGRREPGILAADPRPRATARATRA